VFQQSSGQTFSSVLNLRVADKKSSASPNKVDMSLVNSQLIYFVQRYSLLQDNCKQFNEKLALIKAETNINEIIYQF
jgi:hypothetical protein